MSSKCTSGYGRTIKNNAQGMNLQMGLGQRSFELDVLTLCSHFVLLCKLGAGRTDYDAAMHPEVS